MAISAGADHTCALMGDDDDAGEATGLGSWATGSKPPSSTSRIVQVSEIASAVAISAGQEFACALLADSTVECWGANDSGQLRERLGIDGQSCEHPYRWWPAPRPAPTRGTFFALGAKGVDFPMASTG